MLVLVVVLQLYTWFIAHSPAGTLVSIIVVAFLLRGAWRMFQDYAEQKMEAGRGSNQAMQPTAGRRTASLSMTKPRSFKAELGPTSGG